MPDDDFAYLHDWGEIGVVGDVSHDLFRVRAEAGLKPFHRVAKDVAHADVRSWTTRLAASEAFVHRVVQAGIAHARLHQWHVFVAVVRMIKPGSRSVRVHHADLDHAMSPCLVISQYRSTIVSRQVNPEELVSTSAEGKLAKGSMALHQIIQFSGPSPYPDSIGRSRLLTPFRSIELIRTDLSTSRHPTDHMLISP